MKIVLAHTLQSAEYFLTDFSAREDWEEHMEIVTLGPQLFLSTEDQYCSLGRGWGALDTAWRHFWLSYLICSLMILVALFPNGASGSRHSN